MVVWSHVSQNIAEFWQVSQLESHKEHLNKEISSNFPSTQIYLQVNRSSSKYIFCVTAVFS